MKKKKKEPLVKISIRIGEKILKEADRIAKKNKIKRSEFIREAVEKLVDEWKSWR